MALNGIASRGMESVKTIELLKSMPYFGIKPSGQLIFSIPYFEGLEYKWFKEYTYSLHLPNHITFLNKKVEISGLEPEAFSLLTKRDTSYTISPVKHFILFRTKRYKFSYYQFIICLVIEFINLLLDEKRKLYINIDLS